ncbi:CDP-glycerol glycerophosphotransferase family protein [Campylobacter sputorum]|uniref:CDP-glycerol glycerophosphotransferase family protein n=1 Tax=Campylobacter sputorum TaxID=206 RepID=UPI00137471DD|nr:CDP-glycerol glycerophosphotransferase family protein [Campylobacter sputorum]
MGFIDTSKKCLHGISSINLDDVKEFDYIVIYSSNHEKEIYDYCIHKISKDKILCAYLNKYKEYKLNSTPQELPFVRVSKILDEKIPKLKDEILFIGFQFIDLNIKYLYLYFLQNSHLKIHLATYNKRDYELYKKAGFDVIWCDSEEFVEQALSCKVKVIDQTPTAPFLIKALKIGKCVQLWHGITIETLGILADYKVIKYSLMLSTSHFVSKYSFSKFYNYEKIITSGYPRNDILRKFKCEIFNVDLNLLNDIKTHKFRYIIYTPTHRANTFNKNPLDYEILDKFCKLENIKFIIKMHPFIAEKLRDDLNTYKAKDRNFENIIIYPANMDIYPIMPYCDMMIADYSSMYFDFLFVDKPIVFFPYDYDEWVLSEGGTCLDYFSYSPGDKAYNQVELEELILKNLQNDGYKKEREKIKKIMFENLKYNSCKLIEKEIEKLL